MSSETFLAFGYSLKREVTIEAGVNYDIAAEIDQKNRWREPGEHTDDVAEMRETVQSAAATGFIELLRFCFPAGSALDCAGLSLAFQKFTAVAHHVNCSALCIDNKSEEPITRAELARKLGCTPDQLRSFWRQFRSEHWRFKVHVQRAKAKRT